MFQVIAEVAEKVIAAVEEINITEGIIQDVHELMAQGTEVESSVSNLPSEINAIIEEGHQFEANSSFLRDGHVYQTDDAGRIYRYDNELIPNSEYEINGYKYKTDELGRVTSAEGEAHLKTHQSRLEIKDSKETVSHGDAKETDDRGHIIGDQLDGSNGMENIVAQDAGINQGAYKNLEAHLADAIKEGHKVDIKVEPIYGDKLSYRPTEIKYTYTIDGEKNITLFPNGR
ncbi:DNA/RNA non-specific endonuclease [Butyrivibrio sp. AE2032]|uniref:DNA/RNA non-specific endonuclease n=1 Tax=Butyrivibrio sp. AE2032 TaxID=1458463 RepID=UPI00054FB838|nr:DNA/RNA non-specific endonuclease [Butyrivibrio sp. AE2032]